jgi:(1->4)-alpha-D-glucan 1-alpha-D-glucosylmutase
MPPTATYRLQLRREFGFDQAAAIVPYLADLGISHVYLSPILAAVPGSAHGYDVIDHSRINPELGGEDGFSRLIATCREHGLGIVVDVVPNHMAVPNAAWSDVLEHGRASKFAHWFDIDWSQHGGRVLMPELDGTPAVEKQHHLLVDWRRGNKELNYRRFFDVTTLVGLRVEDDDVFKATHEVLLNRVRAGEIDGLRIDHPDGLADPAGYLRRLRDASGSVWTVVEKIVEGDETLPGSWACDGTTGYDAAAAITQVLTDPAGEQPLSALYADFAGVHSSYQHVVFASKREVVDGLFAAEVSRLVREIGTATTELPEISALDAEAIRRAVTELLVHFPVYRAYADDKESLVRVDEAVTAAVNAEPALSEAIETIGQILRRERSGEKLAAIATRFEQTTGPVMAKGVEDTTFYRWHRLIALNEVGGDPGTFGRDLTHFHSFCGRLARDWPATMTTLSTHDTKRSEDVRARLLVLAEMPDEWRDAVTRWQQVAQRHQPPDANASYLFWQTLVGAWPIEADRLVTFMRKAVKEAKQHTSWVEPNEDYERQLEAFVRAVVEDDELMAEVAGWIADKIEAPARSNMLTQKLLQLTMPGVPDVYQGQELPDFSLVDPDNRRPVDYDQRGEALRSLREPKLRVTASALRLRRARPESFAGDYAAVRVDGGAAGHAIAFRRADDMVVVATRLPMGLQRRGGWDDTAIELPAGDWHDVISDTAIRSNRLGDILATSPVALIVRRGGTSAP